MTYDLYFDAVNSGSKTFGFSTTKAAAVTGMTKVAVRFVKHLFTPVGYELSDASIGTSLPDLIGGNVADAEYVNAVVNLSVKQAAEQVMKIQAGKTTEKQLTAANVLGISFTGTNVDVYVELVMADGTTASLKLPTISTT